MQLTKHWAGALDDYAIDLAWSSEGSVLAAASASGPITLFTAADGQRRHELPGHEGGVNALAWRNSSVLASGGQDGQVKYWDPQAGSHVATTSLGRSWVEHLAWRPGDTGPELAAAAGRALTLIDGEGAIRHRFPDAPKTLSAIAWHPGGGCLACSCFGKVTLWDSDAYLVQKEFPYANGILALAWSTDGRWLVSGNQDPSVHLWVPEEDMELQMSGYETKVRHLDFDLTGRWLATGGGREACVWDCAGPGPEGREPRMLPHDAPVCALAYQNAHGLLATAAADGAVMLWSPERQQPLRATVKMPVAASRLAWAPDDGLLAIGTEKGAVYVLRCTA